MDAEVTQPSLGVSNSAHRVGVNPNHLKQSLIREARIRCADQGFHRPEVIRRTAL